MRHDLEAVRPAFIWDEKFGLAYNYTILSLCHRAVELHGRLRAGPNASCAALAAALPLAEPHRRVPHWYPPAVRQAAEALRRARRCASETAEPTQADGADARAAAKVCADEAAVAGQAEKAAAARRASAQTRAVGFAYNSSRGYCGLADSKSDCATSSMGAWSMNNVTRCIQRCLGCARCNFISFSPELQDCSWYHKCSLAHLQGADGTHGTVQVQRAPRS